jgi:kinesin family protein C1
VEAKDELTARCEAATGEASHQTSRAEKAEAECASLVDLRASAESAATEALEKLQVAQEELANIKQQLEAASALAAEREEGLVAAAANGNVTKFMYSTSSCKKCCYLLPFSPPPTYILHLLSLTVARLEASVSSLQDQLKSEAAAAAELLESTTSTMTNEHASVVASLQQQLSEETTNVQTANAELSTLQANHQAANEKVEHLTAECASKCAALEACEAKAAASARDAEINAVKLEGATSQLTQKATELTMALSSLGDVQKAGAERETQLRETLMQAEAKASAALAASAALKEEVASLQSEVKSTAAELATAQEARDLATSRYAESTKAEAAASAKAQEASDGWTLEKELRARAEAREEEERRERTAATAQLIAQTQAQHELLMAADQKRVEEVAAAEARGSAVREELAASLQSVEAANERALIAEGEAASVRSMLDSTKGQVSELVALAHTSGEMKALEHRMQHQSSEATHKLEEAHARIESLESELRAGEAQRRKMHNLIQELRGNVRVFARVRPFLPGDGVAAENAVPAVHAHADGSSLKIASAQSGEAHNFTFDKAFPPSVGQEQVFQEVSEFVQSALDGYQVCLFSYGQTGSGKTHTMQGSRNGQFRGIIPRAIEQVGRYQATLEAQGWEYNMQVTFVEIYNETVRDLLHEGKGKSEALELKMLKEGGMGVSGATKLNVDPNDLDTIGKILDLAARHRSVGGTDMNAESSRSHSVFTLHLQGVNKGLNSSLQGSLNLVDLAGSERVQRSGATGERMKEAQAINKSLSSLTDVFLAISNKNAHIPFRNSKLTHLLQPCLSGDGKTLMVVNLSPTEESFGESVCSLRFASTVNKCELGKPKKSFKDMGSSDGSSSSSATGKKAKK